MKPSLGIYLNDQQIGTYNVNDDEIHTDGFNFRVDTPGKFNFELRSLNTVSNSGGITVGRVSLRTLDQLGKGDVPCSQANGDKNL